MAKAGGCRVRPEKLSNVDAEFSGGSDHKLIKIVRYAKSLQRNVRYVKKRRTSLQVRQRAWRITGSIRPSGTRPQLP